jgi:predicted extracellular nuclease
MRKIMTIGLVLTTTLFMACRSSDKDDPRTDAYVPTEGGLPPDGLVGGEGGSGTETTVVDIKKEIIKDGAKVILKDVVVTAVDGYGQYTGDMYIQDAAGGEYSGIKMFKNQRGDGGQISDLKPGDHIKVEGTVKHWTGSATSQFPDGRYVIELEDNTVTLLQPGTTTKVDEVTVDKITKDPDAAKWEAALVKVKDVGVLTLPDPQYADFKVTGGLAVDDDLYPHSPQIGDCITVTGISVYFYAFRLNPRSAADIETGSNCPKPKTITIKDIQDTTSADHPAEDDVVTVKGVITAVDSTPSSSDVYKGFWIQDGTGPFSGVYVYHTWKATDTAVPKQGDEVELTATYDEYYDLSELKQASWKVLGQKALPAPEVVDAKVMATDAAEAEKYEGVLVQVKDFTVAKINQDSNQKNVAMEDADGFVIDYALYDFFAATPAPAVGSVYSTITGPLDFTYKKFKIYPRVAGDVVPK